MNFLSLPQDDDALCDPKTVAAYFGLTERTLADWRRAGNGPPYIRAGHKTIRYRAGAVRGHTRSMEVDSTTRETVDEAEIMPMRDLDALDR